MTPAATSPAARKGRLLAACEAALHRLTAKDDEDTFAELGEVLFWLFALKEETRQKDPLLLGLAWARNRIAHGVIVAAPVRPRQYGAEPGLIVLGRAMLGTISEPSAWLQRRDVQLGSHERAREDEEKAYDDHVAGRSVLATVEDALAILR